MNTIIYFITKHIKRKAPTLLGRWKIDYCSKQIHNKIDLANVDHCGTCGDYLINKINTNKTSLISNFKTKTNSKTKIY